nr:MAG: type I-D CRISPR-associated protein Cas10d/Csc3 [Leptolyngbya sp. IPPAS B-1204]
MNPVNQEPDQLSILSSLDGTSTLESDWLEDDTDLEAVANRTIEPAQRELLTLKLLRAAIQAQNPDDAVMNDFANYVLPNLLEIAIGVTAKGGNFFDELDRQRTAADQAKVRRDNAADQSLNTHLLNGLFPANLVEQRLERLNTTIRRVVRERERRLVIAGFILHDFEKFPDVPNDCRKLTVEEHRQIIQQKVQQLGLDYLISPKTPSAYTEYIDDLLCIAYNAQRRWDTNWNFSEYGLNPSLNDRTLRNLSNLTCLADSFASIVKHPQDAEHTRLKELIHELSDGQLRFTYHSIAENQGVLTNIVNNAVMEAHTQLNTEDCIYYEPLLYLPTGVIYLADRNAPPIDPGGLPNRVVAKIKQLCFEQLKLRQTGFGRDGKGMKYADYYRLFCDDRGLMEIALNATLRILSSNKSSVAPNRSANLKKFQQVGALSADSDFSLKDDIRIDQLAEFGDVISRKIWGNRVEQIDQVVKARAQARKKQKTLAELPPVELTPSNLVHRVAEFLGLAAYLPQIREIQAINTTLKENKLPGNTGGVPYEWYFLATRYLDGSGIENVREVGEKIIEYVADLIEPIVAQYQLADGWDDLRDWIQRVVMLPTVTKTQSATEQAEMFLKEFAGYSAAKRTGRGKQAICSISHSAYSVKEQMEAEVLFTPQVYTNKQMLGGSNAKRSISSIAGLEIMLRQILMNQTQATGKRFEDGKYRYLYFYPTYYFTPETNKFLQKAYRSIAQTRFDTSLRNHFISKDLQADFSQFQYQTVDAFLMDEDLEQRMALPETDPNYRRDRSFKLSYPDDQPLTFYFMALPPGKDPTDTESWVMPTWLAFAFPLILDVKMVVSESPIPPFNDGAEFEESVFLDSAPQAFRMLCGQERFRLDAILQGWRTADGTQRSAPLNRLTAAYAIHLDVNAKQGKGGYDPNWSKLTELARDFETSPLYVFNYLNRWVRKQESETARIEKIRLYTYHFYPCFDPQVNFDSSLEQLIVQESSPINHPQKLTDLYRQFYRAGKRYNPKANAVLKPIDVAAEVILKAESSVFYGETLVMAVASEVFKLMDRVRASRAEGFAVISDREAERQAILAFARYFVENLFEQAFAGDRARLAGRQLNLIRDTCEFLYRLAQDKENQELAAKGEPVQPEEDDG